jgi:ParB/RepB/Spo0J family partition protein
MREFRQLSIDAIHESATNPRRVFSEASLDELAASIRRRGVLQPILVRPHDDGFTLIAGARRLRASRLAGCPTIPARVLELDEAGADEATIIENLHRENISPLEEGESYQRLLASGRTIDELTAQLGKSKAYLYQRVSLTRLIPRAQELVAQDILPLNYALKLATVPAERQAEGLAQCFRPLFREEPCRDQLEPLGELTHWIEKSVRLDPRSEDTTVLLPALAEQVVSAEQEREASVLALSTLHFHTDRTDPKPILAKSWKPVEGRQRCQYARPGVIVLGEGQGTFLQVCVEKKKCQKHWGRAKDAGQSSPTETDINADATRKRQEAAWAKRQAETERWRAELRPRALRLMVTRTGKLPWSRTLLGLLFNDLGVDELFSELLGRPDRLPTKRYPQAIAVALALRHSWSLEDLARLAKPLGIKVTAKALNDGSPSDTSSDQADASAGRAINTHARQ